MLRSLEIKVTDHLPLASLSLSGSLARLEVYKLKKQVDELIQNSFRFIILDMTDLDFIDSAGIGVVCQVRLDAQQAGGRLIVVQSRQNEVCKAMSMASLTRLADTYMSLDDAVRITCEKYNLSIDTHGGDRIQQLENRVAQIEKTLLRIENALLIKPSVAG
jgi:anti-anti-sigma factor